MSEFDPNSKLAKVPNINKQINNVVLKEKPKEQPRVIPDVPAPKETLSPSEESIRIEQKLIRLREQMNSKMREFNNLFKLKVLNENKTENSRKQESIIFTDLINNFNRLNELSPDEGTITLIVLCLRHLLSLKDAGNDLAYQIYVLEKEVFGEATEDRARKEDIMKKKEKLQKLQEALDEELKGLEE